MAKVLVPFSAAAGVSSFANMAALQSSAGGPCRLSPDRQLAKSLVLSFHVRPHTGQRLPSEPRRSRLPLPRSRTFAKMVAARPGRRQRPLPRWRRPASGTRFPNPLQDVRAEAAAAGVGARPEGERPRLSARAGTRWSCGSLRPRQELASAVTCGGAKVTFRNPRATQHHLSPSRQNHVCCTR